MSDFRKRRGKGALVQATLRGVGLLALMGVTFFAVEGAWGMYGKFMEASRAREAGERQLGELREQYAQVEAATGSFATGRGVEAALRERYGVAKPGEGEIRIVRQVATSSGLSSQAAGFWSRLWDAVFPF